MKIDENLFRTDTVDKEYSGLDGSYRSGVSCGFVFRNYGGKPQPRAIEHYGGSYLVSGSGVYLDCVTGKEYKITPGCFIQRMPSVVHSIIINPEAKWLEFFIWLDKKIFNLLVETNFITSDAVFYVGESQEILNRLLELKEDMKNANDIAIGEMLFRAQATLHFLNRYKSNQNYDEKILAMCDYIRLRPVVGIKFREVAKELNVGYENIRKKFKKTTGLSLTEYCINERIRVGKVLLRNCRNVKSVAFELGYFDEYAFVHQFKAKTGQTPYQFLKDRC